MAVENIDIRKIIWANARMKIFSFHAFNEKGTTTCMVSHVWPGSFHPSGILQNWEGRSGPFRLEPFVVFVMH
jgi:hypothetical protein